MPLESNLTNDMHEFLYLESDDKVIIKKTFDLVY